jgi:hypothetical protein
MINELPDSVETLFVFGHNPFMFFHGTKHEHRISWRYANLLDGSN